MLARTKESSAKMVEIKTIRKSKSKRNSKLVDAMQQSSFDKLPHSNVTSAQGERLRR